MDRDPFGSAPIRARDWEIGSNPTSARLTWSTLPAPRELTPWARTRQELGLLLKHYRARRQPVAVAQRPRRVSRPFATYLATRRPTIWLTLIMRWSLKGRRTPPRWGRFCHSLAIESAEHLMATC